MNSRTIMGVEDIFNLAYLPGRAIFEEKLKAYGPSFLVFRWVSLIDQIWIKLKRLRSLEEMTDVPRVLDKPDEEYWGIFNYCLIGVLKDRGQCPDSQKILDDPDVLKTLTRPHMMRQYDTAAKETLSLMRDKNHDYRDAWKEMDLRSVTDMMIVKALRLKQLTQKKRPIRPEDDIAAQLMDIANYTCFGLALLRPGWDYLNQKPITPLPLKKRR